MNGTKSTRNKKISAKEFAVSNIISIFAPAFEKCTNMVAVVQLVRASDCGSECRGFESHLPPLANNANCREKAVSVFLLQ